jgi:membrane protein DedA with SNARE-associated domain
MVESIVETIVSFVKAHQGWVIPVAFLVAFLESFCFVSLLWPGTAILVGISGLLAASGIESAVLWPAIIAAGVGGTIGYAISYWIGYYYKDQINGTWPFRSYPDMIPRGERFFEKWGVLGVFFGHFFGPVRAVIPVVAGMYKMPQIPFQIANILSAFMWAGGVIAPSYFGLQYLKDWLA